MFLNSLGIATAPFCVVPAGLEFSDRSLQAWQEAFDRTVASHSTPTTGSILNGSGNTLFVKPAASRSSEGIDATNEVSTCQELNSLVRRLRGQFPEQDMLVETYLWGREFTVAIVGSGAEGYVFAVLEIRIKPSDNRDGQHTNDNKHGEVYTADMKSGLDPSYECVLADKDKDAEAAAAGAVALSAWRALCCRDAGRVDVRSDVRGKAVRPHVIEVRPMLHSTTL